MKKQKSFKKGSVVISGNTAVLVTGSGNKKEAGYPCFSGVVIMEETEDDNHFNTVGTFSSTWNTDAFKPTKINIQPLIRKCL
jgi:hypothetical protein